MLVGGALWKVLVKILIWEALLLKLVLKDFQGDDLSATNTIAACAKHFAGYGFSEAGKDYNTVDIGTNTLYNMVFPPFEACRGRCKTFMNSFNQLNGVPAKSVLAKGYPKEL